MAVQQYCLRWNNHQPNFISVFSTLLHNESLVDVTLAAEGRQLQAHKVVLSACSSYFQSLFTANPCQHPIVILKDVQYNDLKTMVDFMYYGEVNVSTEQLPQVLKTAEMLKIKGLAEMPDAAAVCKADTSKLDHPDLVGAGLGPGGTGGPESLWGSAESQQQQAAAQQQQQQQQVQQQQYHQQLQAQQTQLRRTPSPTTNMSPAARRKRLRKTSTGSGSLSTERMQQQQQHHQQQQQQQEEHGTNNDGTINLVPHLHIQQQVDNISYSTSHSALASLAGAAGGSGNNIRIIKESPSSDVEQQQHESSQESVDDTGHHIPSIIKTEDLGGVAQTIPMDISATSGNVASVNIPQSQSQHSGGQWTVIDTNYSRFGIASCQTSLGLQQHQAQAQAQQHAAQQHHHQQQQQAAQAAAAASQQQQQAAAAAAAAAAQHHQAQQQQQQSDSLNNAASGNNNSNSSNPLSNASTNNSNAPTPQPTTPVQIYQHPFSPQIISVNPNNMVNSYSSSSMSTPTSPQGGNDSAAAAAMVHSVYSQATNANQSPIGTTGTSGTTTIQPVKRKRSVNPQGDENFLRALEAVRFGGIGFCKAARLYGVNNRTLWLEYKKRGYPISRPSIKSRIKLEPNISPPPSTTPTGDENASMEHYDTSLSSPALNMSLQQHQQQQQQAQQQAVAQQQQQAAQQQQQAQQQQAQQQQQQQTQHQATSENANAAAAAAAAAAAVAASSATPLMCPPHAHPMGVMGFLDTRHVDFTTAAAAGIHQMSRQRYPDTTTVNMNTGAVNLQGLNFNSM
ncbi:longitudinals lacking protein, isoforms J/P/Q/S/Z isoform X2 [Wyeomyia smithii]|uniref:longitudinals lacking protein, isoforms J/P/Q/S/Z isoform X2 n=1 Tax=Wyeomyia smithii TaxID=174621 RepID=UPI002467E434|nr:longitudinals lacking protein, isoforms J/P/Q/S/Z isoform X2 [Wyeomyia smithii]